MNRKTWWLDGALILALGLLVDDAMIAIEMMAKPAKRILLKVKALKPGAVSSPISSVSETIGSGSAGATTGADTSVKPPTPGAGWKCPPTRTWRNLPPTPNPPAGVHDNRAHIHCPPTP